MPSADGPSDATSVQKPKHGIFLFALFDAAVLFFVVVPAVLYLFALDNGLSERELMLYVIGLLALYGAVTVLLLWLFRVVPGPRSGNRDAR